MISNNDNSDDKRIGDEACDIFDTLRLEFEQSCESILSRLIEEGKITNEDIALADTRDLVPYKAKVIESLHEAFCPLSHGLPLTSESCRWYEENDDWELNTHKKWTKKIALLKLALRTNWIGLSRLPDAMRYMHEELYIPDNLPLWTFSHILFNLIEELFANDSTS